MKEVPFVPLAINRGHNEFSRETRESRDGIRGRGPLNDEPPPREKKKKEIEKKKRFRSFMRGDTIFVISNNRRSPRERERLADTHGREKILRARGHHVARSLMTADISQTSRTTKYANVTATSNDRRAALSAGIRGAKVEARVNECHERAESK